MKNPFAAWFQRSLKRKHEVAIMYFGRISDSLLMTSERMVISNEVCTLGQMLKALRQRGGRWACELDGSQVVCTINGKTAALSDAIEEGVEIGIFSRKSLFEA